jgi:hypothetical protein
MSASAFTRIAVARTSIEVLRDLTRVGVAGRFRFRAGISHLVEPTEKLTRSPSEEPGTTGADLKDEEAVIQHCLRICEEAMSHIESLADRERRLHSDAASERAEADTTTGQPTLFQAHQETREVLDHNRDSISMQIGRLQERLKSLTSNKHLGGEREIALLKEDIRTAEECLEVCKIALGEVDRQKTHSFGEVVAEDSSD